MNNKDEGKYKVVLIKDQSGERVPFLIEAISGLPVPEANQWRLLMRRARCQHGTLKREMLELSYLYRWAAERSIDLQDRMNAGQGIRMAESTDLIDYLRRNFMRPSEGDLHPRVSPVVQQQRFATIRHFIGWWFDLVLDRLPVSNKAGDLRYARIKDQRDRIMRWLEPPSGKSPSREGLTPSLRKKFLDVIRPDSGDNPWSYANRLRNYVVLALYFWLGLRLSELLLLKCHHLDVTPGRGTVLIERAPDDPEDPRHDAPEAKTLGRELPIPTSVSPYLREYLRRVRSKTGNAKRHPFVFVSYRDGAPLSKRGVQHILAQVRRRHPEFRGVLTIHVLRNCWSDMTRARLKEMVESKQIDSEFAKLLFNYLGGWSHGSAQSNKYSRGEIQRSANEALVEIHDELFQHSAT